MADVVDVVYVNIVTWSVGCLGVGGAAKGWTVASKPGTRVDGHSHHEQEKLVFQASKKVGNVKGIGK